MQKKDLANVFLLMTVFVLSLFIYLTPVAAPSGSIIEEKGKVLGERITTETDDAPFSLFVGGLLSKRKELDDSNCDFVVSEESSEGSIAWEGELIWSDPDNYKIFMDQGRKIIAVNQGEINEIKDDGSKEYFGTIDDDASGFLKFSEIRNYVFEDFLAEVAENLTESNLAGEEVIDGTRYYIFQSKISIINSGKEINRTFYVSGEGVFLKAFIEEKTNDYEVYDSSGEAVAQKGYVKNINIEVKNRVFF